MFSSTQPRDSAQAWQESLVTLSGIADEQLDKVEYLHQTRRPNIPQHNFPAALSMRAQSAPRSQSAGRQANEAKEAKGMRSNYPQELLQPTSHSYEGSERKVDFLMKKVKFLEDKLKRTEKDSSSNIAEASKHSSILEQLIETQKEDRKNVLALKEQIAATRSNIDVLHHRDEVRENALQRPIPGQLQSIDIDSIKEVIFTRIQADFSTVIQEVVKACASEQANFLSNWAEKEKAERDKAYRGGEGSSANLIGAMEREVTRLNAESARLKNRQDSLEGTYLDLRTAINSREMEAEEAHRKAISSYRMEMQSILDTMGRKMNETLAFMHTDPAIEDFKRQFEQCLMRHDHDLSRLDANLQIQNERIEEVREQAERLSTASSLALAQCVELQDHSRGLENGLLSVESSISNLHRVQAQSDSRLESVCDSVMSLQGSLDRQAREVASFRDNIHSRTEAAAQSIKIESEERKMLVQQLSESNKKTRAKVREYGATLEQLTRTRESIESLLAEVESRSQRSDQQWSAQVTAAVGTLEQRLRSVESGHEVGTHSNESKGAEMSNNQEKLEQQLLRLEKEVKVLREGKVVDSKSIDSRVKGLSADLVTVSECVRVLQAEIGDLPSVRDNNRRSQDSVLRQEGKIEALQAALLSLQQQQSQLDFERVRSWDNDMARERVRMTELESVVQRHVASGNEDAANRKESWRNLDLRVVDLARELEVVKTTVDTVTVTQQSLRDEVQFQSRKESIELVAKWTSQNDSIEALEAAVESIQQQQQQQQRESLSMGMALQETSSSVDQLRVRVDGLEGKCEELDSLVVATTSKVDEEVTLSAERWESVSGEAESVAQQVRDIQTEVAALKESVAGKAESVAQQVRNIQTEVAALKESVAGEAALLAETGQLASVLSTSFQSLQGDFKHLQQESQGLLQLGGKVELLTAAMSTCKSEAIKHEQMILHLAQSKTTEVSSQGSVSHAASDEIRAQLQMLELQLEERVKGVLEGVRSLQGEVSGLQGLRESERRVLEIMNEVTTKMTTINERIDDVTQQILRSEDAVLQVAQSAQTSSASVMQLRNEVLQKFDLTSSQTRQVADAIASSVRELESELESMRQDLEELKQRHGHSHVELPHAPVPAVIQPSAIGTAAAVTMYMGGGEGASRQIAALTSTPKLGDSQGGGSSSSGTGGSASHGMEIHSHTGQLPDSHDSRAPYTTALAGITNNNKVASTELSPPMYGLHEGPGGGYGGSGDGESVNSGSSASHKLPQSYGTSSQFLSAQPHPVGVGMSSRGGTDSRPSSIAVITDALSVGSGMLGAGNEAYAPALHSRTAGSFAGSGGSAISTPQSYVNIYPPAADNAEITLSPDPSPLRQPHALTRPLSEPPSLNSYSFTVDDLSAASASDGLAQELVLKKNQHRRRFIDQLGDM